MKEKTSFARPHSRYLLVLFGGAFVFLLLDLVLGLVEGRRGDGFGLAAVRVVPTTVARDHMEIHMWHRTAETLDIYAQDVEFHHHLVPGNRGSGDVGVAAGRTPRPESMATLVLADSTSEALVSL